MSTVEPGRVGEATGCRRSFQVVGGGELFVLALRRRPRASTFGFDFRTSNTALITVQ